MLNRKGSGTPFLFDYKFFTLVRFILLRITARPGQKLLHLTHLCPHWCDNSRAICVLKNGGSGTKRE